MARLNVNPTRMELSRLKNRLKTAVRGHKLLKDKSDEMIRRFMSLIRENKRIREEAESGLQTILREFMLARAVTPFQTVEEAVAMPPFSLTLATKTKNLMGVNVPEIRLTETGKPTGAALLPYSLLTGSGELDNSVLQITAFLPRLIALAEIEKTCNMLAGEIEKNRRRVNALQYVMIPQIEETIAYIKMKLDENERGALTRLMKVKDLLEKED